MIDEMDESEKFMLEAYCAFKAYEPLIKMLPSILVTLYLVDSMWDELIKGLEKESGGLE